MNKATMPKGWKVTGWGPEGEGAEAKGPAGESVTACTVEELPAAIRAHLAGLKR